uniref:Transposase Tc1-like domain-containing protein n=1 Tax=Nothobranchius furzeri TaxID=105023 RepID=A0A8C6LTC4_NOTFU
KNFSKSEKGNNFFTEQIQNTVAKVVQKFKKDGSATILQKHPGHQLELTSQQEHLLMRRLKKITMKGHCRVAKAVESQTGVAVSRDIIRRTLQRNGMQGYRPRRQPLLKPVAHDEGDELIAFKCFINAFQ